MGADPFVAVDEAQARSMAHLLRYVLGGLEGGAQGLISGKAAQLAQALVQEHLRALLNRPLPAAMSAALEDRQIAGRAEDFLQAHYFEPLRLEDIAGSAGVTPRRLQALFKATTGKTPWQRLAEIRLDHAHRALSDLLGDRSVTEIAMDCGLFHLGRFSQAYRAKYNETPSFTLTRARRAAAAVRPAMQIVRKRIR